MHGTLKTPAAGAGGPTADRGKRSGGVGKPVWDQRRHRDRPGASERTTWMTPFETVAGPQAAGASTPGGDRKSTKT